MTLLSKLVAVNLVAIACVLLIVYMAIEYFAAGYFTTLMEMYDISPTDAHQLFLRAVYRTLAAAAVLSIAVAIVIGYLLTSRILRPLRQMNQQTQRIADGDFTGEIDLTTHDEVGRLARSFNRMCRGLERSDRARRRLILDVAHELRSPVTNIRGYLEALRDGVIVPTRAAFESLHEETLLLGAQVEDMLFLSRAEGVGVTMVSEQLNLAGLVRDVSALFAPRFARKQICLRTDTLPARLDIDGDAPRVARVLRNVFENAWRYTPAGGRCEVSLALRDEAVDLRFCNGPVDVSDASLPRLFDRFYRADDGSPGAPTGAGIGLAIVKEVVAAHGGTVGAEKVALDRLCIRLTLPRRCDAVRSLE